MAGQNHNVRNTRTTHPLKSARRERALQRLGFYPGRANDQKYMNAKDHERKALMSRIGKPPRHWPSLSAS